MYIIQNIIPVIVLFIVYILSLFFNLAPADWNGWLGFAGSIAGSAIAIYGVYWQVKKGSEQSKDDAQEQIKLLQKQISQEKEMNFSFSRPFFLIDQREIDLQKTRPVFWAERKPSLAYMTQVPTYYHLNLLEIHNVSDKAMLAIKVEVRFANETVGKIWIPRISSNSSVNIAFNTALDDMSGNIYANVWPKHPLTMINKVEVNFTTEIREKIKLVFSDELSNGKLKYQRELKRIENKGDLIEDYDTSEFDRAFYINLQGKEYDRKNNI
ncbi:hypothetical protein [Lactiplantibacillus pentosus]